MKTITVWIHRVCVRILFWTMRETTGMSCGNRQSRTFRSGPLEFTYTVRDTSRPDAYSREELIRMIRTVRSHEAIQGWKVPDL